MTWRISNASSTSPWAGGTTTPLCAAGLRTRRAIGHFLRGGYGDPPRKRVKWRCRISLRAGGTTTLRSRVRAGRRAFTLVELITVMAIMAILMAMIVGVAPRIQDAWRARLTRTRLLAVVAALQAYAGDYSGKFPYTEDKDGIMADVTAAAILGVDLSSAPSTYGVEGFTKAEVVLYGALTSTRRRGPYYKGAGGQTVVRKGTGDTEFNLLADGWERPIRYEYSTVTGLLVRSLGKDGTTGGDDIDYFVFQN